MKTLGIEEKILLIRIRSGKAELFLNVYNNYSKSIYRYINFKIGHKETVEDINSEVFAKALEYILDKDRPIIRNLRPFLYQLARAAVADHYRAKTNNLELGEDICDAKSADSPIETSMLEKSLNSLPDEQREAIMLKHVEGLSASEIGSIMDRSEGAIRVLIHRGMEKIREEVGDLGV